MSQDDPAEAVGGRSAARASASQLPAPSFEHLRGLTDRAGLWDGADAPPGKQVLSTADNARALVVVSRQAGSAGGLADLAATYLGFVLEARSEHGFHRGRSADGTWLDEAGDDDTGDDDTQGRAWWGLGAVARMGPTAWMRQAGLDAFASSASFDSPELRANAYAALGAAEVLAADADHLAARQLLDRASKVIVAAARAQIPWPETRLTYDNARLPQALLAAGAAFSDPQRVSMGTRLLEWLVRSETNGDHFSFTPAGGWERGEPRPGFTQRSVEAWGMASACHQAWTVSGDPVWRSRARRAARWVMGRNDTGLVLYDEESGATSDGLTEDSVDPHRGAEAAVAGIGVLQVAAMCTSTRPPPKAR